MSEDRFWMGTALFRGDVLSKACLGGVEAVLRTPQRLRPINKCLREAYVLAETF